MSRRTELWDEFRQAILEADLVELRALLADPQLPALHEDWSTNQGQSLFGLALSSGSVEMVSAIVEADRSSDFWDPINCRSESLDGKTGVTPLAVALSENNESVASWLVKQGANVNAPYRWSDRPAEEVEIAGLFDDNHGGRERRLLVAGRWRLV